MVPCWQPNTRNRQGNREHTWQMLMCSVHVLGLELLGSAEDFWSHVTNACLPKVQGSRNKGILQSHATEACLQMDNDERGSKEKPWGNELACDPDSYSVRTERKIQSVNILKDSPMDCVRPAPKPGTSAITERQRVMTTDSLSWTKAEWVMT